jgi:hypothetical protein
MPAPYRPLPGDDPNDPVAQPKAPPNPPATVGDFVGGFRQPWVTNDPSYWTQKIAGTGGMDAGNLAYWTQRMTDAPGMGSNSGSARQERRPYSGYAKATPDLAQTGPQTSDAMQQIMEELQAQQTGAPSPRARDLQLQMLRGN